MSTNLLEHVLRRRGTQFVLSRIFMIFVLLVFGVNTTNAAKPPPKEPKRYQFQLYGDVSGDFTTGNQNHTASPKRQVKAAAWVGMVSLDDFFDGMMFKPGVWGDTCFLDPDTYSGEFHVNWDTDSTSATFWLEGFAANGENFIAGTPVIYRLDFFGDGFFIEDVNPTQLVIDNSATMTATHWLLTSTAKGRLKSFTCTGSSIDSPDLLPFSGVTIKVTRKEPHPE